MANSDNVELKSRVEAMLLQERRTKRCRNYFSDRAACPAGEEQSEPKVDETCRKAMVDWCHTVADTFGLSRETVGVAISLFDRYLSSGRGKSQKVLANRHEFQLAAITSFFLAVKLHEPVQMGIPFVVSLCRGIYKDSEILSMEQDILFSLEWRVSGPSPMDFAKHFLQLVPESVNEKDVEIILRDVQKNADAALGNIYFSTCKASTVGIVCLIGAVNNGCVLSDAAKKEFWFRVSNTLQVDISTDEVVEAQYRFFAQESLSTPRRPSRATLPRANSICCNGTDAGTSPVSVSQFE